MTARGQNALKTIEKTLKGGEWLTTMRIGCLWLVVKNNAQGANYFLLMSRNASYIFNRWAHRLDLREAISSYRDLHYDSPFFQEVPDRTSETKIKRGFGDTWSELKDELEQCPFEDPKPPQLAPIHQWAQEPRDQ